MIGPTLPPHLRKKTEEKMDIAEDNASEDPTSPLPKSVTGPQLPPHLLAAREAKRKRKREEESDKEPAQVLSPPSPKRVSKLSSPVDSDSDTEVGPSLAAMMTPAQSSEHTRKTAIERLSRVPEPTTNIPTEPTLKRDSWMLAPPTRADWLGSLDASKLKNRTFNQSKSGTNTQSKPVDHSIWTETPLERAQRLEDEALGRRAKITPAQVEEENKQIESAERDRRIKEYNAQTRGQSLMEKYTSGKNVEDDDPSKRAFDYQKDIAGGRTLGFKERDALIGRAKNLDSKYSGGNYL